MNAMIVIGIVIGLAIVAGVLRVRSAVRMSDEQARREAGVSMPEQRGVEPKGREW
jgi:hypothetical protein